MKPAGRGATVASTSMAWVVPSSLHADAAVVGHLQRALAVAHGDVGVEHAAVDALVVEVDVADPFDPSHDPLVHGAGGRGGLEDRQVLLGRRHEGRQGWGAGRVVADVDVDAADAPAAGVEGDRGRAVLGHRPLGRQGLGQGVEPDVGDHRIAAGCRARRLDVDLDVGTSAVAVGHEGDVALVAAAVADDHGDLVGQPLDLGVEVQLAVGVDHVDVGGEVDLAGARCGRRSGGCRPRRRTW